MDTSFFWNKRIENLKPYTPGEQPRGEVFIKLNTNENPYPPSPLVLEAIKNAANAKLRLYPDPAALDLRTAIAEKYSCAVQNVFAGNGSDEILAFAFGAFFDGGGCLPSVSFPDVTYSFYPVYAGFWGLNYKLVPLNTAWEPDIKDYLKGNDKEGNDNKNDEDERRSGVILANPNAPTGLALPKEQVLGLAAGLLKQKRILIVDEAYCDFANESVVPYIKEYNNLLVIKTLSKSCSLAGLRVGFSIGAEGLIAALERIRDSFNSYTVDSLAQAGALAAIKDSAYYDLVNAKIIATRERVKEELLKKGFDVLPSKANFIFIKHPNLPGEEFLKYLRENHILVRHFNKERTKDYLRVTIGTDAEMDEFLSVVIG